MRRKINDKDISSTLINISFPFQICGLAYAFVSWQFFSERVVIEESMLISFFGRDYTDYQKRVPTGLPFIKGYENPYGEEED